MREAKGSINGREIVPNVVLGGRGVLATAVGRNRGACRGSSSSVGASSTTMKWSVAVRY